MVMRDESSTFDAGDDFADELLLAAAKGPAPRAEFVEALERRLDSEFAALMVQPRALPGGSSNSAGPLHDVERRATPGQSPGLTSDNVANGVMARPARRHARRARRWQLVAAAAALLVGVAIWSDPPAWANFLRGLVGFDEPAITQAPKLDNTASARGRILLGRKDVEKIEKLDRDKLRGNLPADALVISTTTPATETPAATTAPVEIDATALDDVALTAARIAPPADGKLPDWKPADIPLADDQLSQQIDALLEKSWQEHGIHPAQPASDAEFMRRVYLDLTGRVPSVAEAREFLSATEPNRREALVDRLLSHRDHATNFAFAWRSILLPAEVDLSRLGGAEKFDQWLAERFAANEPYDKIVEQLLMAEGRVSESGPLLFYAAVKLNPEELAARTSRVFLGVRMECAQCHDHPFDDDISQQDFWSFAALFARISRPEGKMEMTSPVLQVRDNRSGDVKIPESEEIVPPRLPETETPLVESDESPSRRRQMVDWLTARDNKHFAQATVNRVWAHLFGRGLVEPVDDMRLANPAIVPEVLDALASDFAASGFDLRRLVRALVLTKAYQLSSESTDDDPSRTLYFAQMNIKSFTAEQLYDCITVVTGSGGAAAAGPDLTGLARTGDATRAAFIAQFRTQPGQATDYQAGIPQALTMMHGALVSRATDKTTSGLLKSLSAPFFTDEQRVDALFLATLSRYPTEGERDAVVGALTAAGAADRQQALGDVLWALVNSAEFTLNH
jgi:hypothetical protein